MGWLNKLVKHCYLEITICNQNYCITFVTQEYWRRLLQIRGLAEDF